MHLPHLHHDKDEPREPVEHPVLDAAVAPVVDLFSTTHHDSWEDAVRHYDETHPTSL